MEAREGESAGGDDQRAEQPRGPRTPSVRRDIEFHRHPEKGGDLYRFQELHLALALHHAGNRRWGETQVAREIGLGRVDTL